MAIEHPSHAAGAARRPDRPDVFVSYAHEDKQFVSGRLAVSLEARGKDVWTDREDIPAAADWRERIAHGIEAARAFVFVLSPDSLASDQCAEELRQAIAANKRLIPVVYRDVQPESVPDELSRPNWIWLREDDDYENEFERLVKALETDLAWVDSHARLGVRAGEWTRGDRDRGFLLRGNDLRDAERWLAAEASHDEAPTPEQREYIRASRQAATRRQFVTVAAVAVALVISAGLGALAIVRADQRQTALAQRQLSDSRQVAAEAGVLHASRPDLSMLLGVQAFRIAPTVEARGSLLSEQAQHYAGMLPHHSGALTIAFSPDGRTLATNGDQGIELWDVARHVVLASFASPGSIDSLAFSPNGKLLAGSGSSGVVIWDAHGRHREVAVCKPPGTSVQGIAFSRDSRTIAAADLQGAVDLIAVPTCNVVKRFELFAQYTSEVAFNPVDPTMLAAMGDHQRVKLLNIQTGARLASFPGNTNPVFDSAMAFTRDGRSLAIAGPDHTVTIWSTRTHALRRTLRGSPNGVNGIAFSPDGRTVATTSGSTSILWDVRAARALTDLPPLGGQLSDVAFSPGGDLLATNSEAGIQLWKARKPIFQDAFRVLRVAYSHDGKTLAVANANSTVTLLDARTHNRRMTLTTTRQSGLGSDVRDMAFSPDDRLLATVGRNSAKLWNLETGALLHEEKKDDVDSLTSIAFSPDGRTLAFAGLPGPIVLFDVRTHRIKSRLGVSGDFAGYGQLIFTGDGRHLVGVVPDVDVWDVRTGKHVASLGAPEPRGGSIQSAAVSADGNTLAGGLDDGSIVLWNLRTRKRLPRQLNNLGGHTGPINDLAFSPDGRTLATAGEDETVKLWDLGATHRLSGTLTGHRGPVNSVFFSRDGTLVSGSQDQTAISWDLDPTRVTSQICRTLRATLGRSDWTRYVPNVSYGRVCPAYPTAPRRLSVGPRPKGIADLVRRLPGETHRITAMDMRRARRELGVAPDLDPMDYRGRQSTQIPVSAFYTAALMVVGDLVGVVRPAPAASAIDQGRVTAGVEGALVGAEIVLLATDQPMAKIEDGLRRRGFRSRGSGLYLKRSAKQYEHLPVVALAPGLVVLSNSAREASAALTRTVPDAPTATNLKRLEAVPGSLRVLQSHGEVFNRRAPCLETVVGGHGFARSADTLTLYLTQPGRASRVLLGSAVERHDILTRAYQPEDIRVSGTKISMRVVTRPGALQSDNAATIADGTVQPELIYKCAGAARAAGSQDAGSRP